MRKKYPHRDGLFLRFLIGIRGSCTATKCPGHCRNGSDTGPRHGRHPRTAPFFHQAGTVARMVEWAGAVRTGNLDPLERQWARNGTKVGGRVLLGS